MSDVRGPTPTDPVHFVEDATKRRLPADDRQASGKEGGEQRHAQGQTEESRQTVRDPAISIAPSTAHLAVGDQLVSEISQVDPSGRPIIVTDQATIALRPDAGLKAGDQVSITVTQADHDLIAKLTLKNGNTVDPPITLFLTITALHDGAVEEQATQIPGQQKAVATPSYAQLGATILKAGGLTQLEQLNPASTAESIQNVPNSVTPSQLSNQTAPIAGPLTPQITAPSASSFSTTLVWPQVSTDQTVIPGLLVIAPQGHPVDTSGLPFSVQSIEPISANRLPDNILRFTAPDRTEAFVQLTTNQGQFIAPADIVTPGLENTSATSEQPQRLADFIRQEGVSLRLIQAQQPEPSQTSFTVTALPLSQGANIPQPSDQPATVLKQHPVQLQFGVAPQSDALTLQTIKVIAPTGTESSTSPTSFQVEGTQLDHSKETPRLVQVTTSNQAVYQAYIPANTPLPTPGTPVAIFPSAPQSGPVSQTSFHPEHAPLPPIADALAAGLGSLPPLNVEKGASWPAFEAVTGLVDQGNPTAQSLSTRTVVGSGSLSRTMSFFLTALGRGTPETWIGDQTRGQLEAKAPTLLDVLKRDVNRLMQAAVEPTADGQWRVFQLPYDLKDGDLSFLTLLLRREKGDEETEHGADPESSGDEQAEATRFLLEVNFSLIGPIQLDGRLNDKFLSLIIRAQESLPDGLATDVRSLFKDITDSSDLSGRLVIQEQAELLDDATHALSGI